MELRNKYFSLSPNSAVRTLDYKVSDLQKRLNKLRGKTKKKGDYLDLLAKELIKMEKEVQVATKVAEVTEFEQRQRYLENEIHKTSLKMMEGDMVRKKYDVILDMLRREQMHYARQAKQLEDLIVVQNKDISNEQRLQILSLNL